LMGGVFVVKFLSRWKVFLQSGGVGGGLISRRDGNIARTNGILK